MPGADRRFTGSYEIGSYEPGSMPVTQWLNDRVPAVNRNAWRLVVSSPGAERSFSLDQLAGGTDRVRAVLDCTGGWFAEQGWRGTSLARLIDGLGQSNETRSILVVSVTGYERRFPVRDLGRLLLATHLGGEELSPGHGFPARLVAPGRRGFWWVKWVERVELRSTPWWWQSPFPLA